jgi:hypothetical protein
MKTELATLIEAYAAARASGNRVLVEFAATRLNELLTKIEIQEPTETEQS